VLGPTIQTIALPACLTTALHAKNSHPLGTVGVAVKEDPVPDVYLNLPLTLGVVVGLLLGSYTLVVLPAESREKLDSDDKTEDTVDGIYRNRSPQSAP
jgi:hypothetical protein